MEEYKKAHPFLIKNTDHLIFLSSYRVYANEQHPLTESAPRLTEVLDDEEFMEFIRGYNETHRPHVLELIGKRREKNIIIFNSREQADEFLNQIKKCKN